MPHIILKGVDSKHVEEFSLTQVGPLAQIIDCPEDHITVEFMPIVFYQNGVANQGGYPFVNIQWFNRSYEVREKVAQFFNHFFSQRGYSDNAVIFTDLKPDYYYENGHHF